MHALAGMAFALAFLWAASVASGATTGSIVLHNKTFRCGSYSQPLRLTLLKVTMRRRSGGDAIGLNRGNCRGSIDRIEVKTWSEDGVKVGPTAHDLVIGGGFVRCFRHRRGVHQDAVQAMGGRRVTFEGLVVRCGSSNHSSFFVNRGLERRRTPKAIVCRACNLRGGGTTVHIGRAIRSGVVDSVVYAGRHTAFRGNRRTDLWSNNTVVPYGD
jgi:hypothetical protein